jgi:3-phosphoglycerate kinase
VPSQPHAGPVGITEHAPIDDARRGVRAVAEKVNAAKLAGGSDTQTQLRKAAATR